MTRKAREGSASAGKRVCMRIWQGGNGAGAAGAGGLEEQQHADATKETSKGDANSITKVRPGSLARCQDYGWGGHFLGGPVEAFRAP